MGATYLNKPGGFIPVGASGNVKLRDTMTWCSFWRFPPSLLKLPSPNLSSAARAVPFKPFTPPHPALEWNTLFQRPSHPSKHLRHQTPLHRDRRKLQNIISCSGDSYICPVQRNLKCHPIYSYCSNCYTEHNTLNTLLVGFRSTNFHQLIPMLILHSNLIPAQQLIQIC